MSNLFLAVFISLEAFLGYECTIGLGGLTSVSLVYFLVLFCSGVRLSSQCSRPIVSVLVSLYLIYPDGIEQAMGGRWGGGRF